MDVPPMGSEATVRPARLSTGETPGHPGYGSNNVTSSYTRFQPGTKKPVVMTGWDRGPGDRQGAQLFWVARKARTFSACFAVTPVSL